MRLIDWLSVSFRVVVLLCLFSSAASAAPQVWTGLTTSFTKAAFADPTLPENQDQLSPSVALTRASLRGMYNAVSELGYTHPVSPLDTEWATTLVAGNGRQTIEAANWASLTFAGWEMAYGSRLLLATIILELPAVLHLITEDIYLDIQFTEWGVGLGGGGSFSYQRADVPEPAAVALLTVGLLGMLGLRRPGRVGRS